MWRLKVASDSDGSPLLQTLNNFAGRLTWQFAPTAGTAAERDFVETAREAFSRSRHQQQHSSDVLYRSQYAGIQQTKRKQVRQPSGHLRVYLRELACHHDALLQNSSEATVDDTIRAGISYYQSIQSDSGLWPGDYGGPMFLMPGLLIALYISKSVDTVLGPEHRMEMLRYLRNHQNQDGGFGLHIEGHSTMFGTALRSGAFRNTSHGADLRWSAWELAERSCSLFSCSLSVITCFLL